MYVGPCEGIVTYFTAFYKLVTLVQSDVCGLLHPFTRSKVVKSSYVYDFLSRVSPYFRSVASMVTLSQSEIQATCGPCPSSFLSFCISPVHMFSPNFSPVVSNYFAREVLASCWAQ